MQYLPCADGFGTLKYCFKQGVQRAIDADMIA